MWVKTDDNQLVNLKQMDAVYLRPNSDKYWICALRYDTDAGCCINLTGSHSRIECEFILGELANALRRGDNLFIPANVELP